MDAKRSWRNQPTIEPGLGDDAFAVEKTNRCANEVAGSFDRRHEHFPSSGSPFLGSDHGGSGRRSSVLQLLDRLANERLEAGAAGVEMHADGAAHARVP